MGGGRFIITFLCKQLFIEFTTELNHGFNWNAASRVRAKNNVKSIIKFIVFGLRPVHQRHFQSAVFYIRIPGRTGNFVRRTGT